MSYRLACLCALSVSLLGCKESFVGNGEEASGSEEASTSQEEATATAAEAEAEAESGDGDGDGDATTGGDGDGDGEAMNQCGEQDVTFGFTAGAPVEVGNNPIRVIAGNFFDSSAVDLIVLSFADGQIQYRAGNGNAAFVSSESVFTGGSVRRIEMIDIDDDGTPEILAPWESWDQPTVSELHVYASSPPGNDVPQIALPSPTFGLGVDAIDLNDDGLRDEILVAGGSSTPGDPTSQITVFSDIAGVAATSTHETSTSMPWYTTVGDFDGDGIDDVAVSQVDEGRIADPDQVDIFLGDGTTLSWWVSLAGGNDPRDLGSADFDGDGNLDLAVAINNMDNPDSEADVVEIWLGDGTGNFVAGTPVSVGAGPSALEIEDVDCDGELDLLVTAEGDNAVHLMRGNGDATFTLGAVLPVGAAPSTIAVGDFNGDSRPDLAVGNFDDDTVSILLADQP